MKQSDQVHPLWWNLVMIISFVMKSCHFHQLCDEIWSFSVALCWNLVIFISFVMKCGHVHQFCDGIWPFSSVLWWNLVIFIKFYTKTDKTDWYDVQQIQKHVMSSNDDIPYVVPYVVWSGTCQRVHRGPSMKPIEEFDQFCDEICTPEIGHNTLYEMVELTCLRMIDVLG